MIKSNTICLAFIFLFFSGYSQNDSIPKDSVPVIVQPDPETKAVRDKKETIYKINKAVDIPIIAAGTGFSLYAFTKIYTKGPSTVEQINNLNKNDINSFDKWAVYPYSKSLDKFSYYPFYASIPLPFIALLMSNDTRRDFWQLSFLYWETLSITGIFGSGAPLYIDRYRPYAYTPETPMEQRQVQNAKNSAFSGHVEVIGASTFFIAKVYSDYYPEKKLLMYSLASVATGGMAYMRLQGGMHFPSDCVIGSAIGVLSGILVPQFHKKRIIKNPNMSLMPFTNGEAKGLAFVYRLR